jgi:hypothetical protein
MLTDIQNFLAESYGFGQDKRKSAPLVDLAALDARQPVSAQSPEQYHHHECPPERITRQLHKIAESHGKLMRPAA